MMTDWDANTGKYLSISRFLLELSPLQASNMLHCESNKRSYLFLEQVPFARDGTFSRHFCGEGTFYQRRYLFQQKPFFVEKVPFSIESNFFWRRYLFQQKVPFCREGTFNQGRFLFVSKVPFARESNFLQRNYSTVEGTFYQRRYLFYTRFLMIYEKHQAIIYWNYLLEVCFQLGYPSLEYRRQLLTVFLTWSGTFFVGGERQSYQRARKIHGLWMRQDVRRFLCLSLASSLSLSCWGQSWAAEKLV